MVVGALNNNHQNIKWLLLNRGDVDATDNDGDRADVYSCKELKRLILEHRNK